MQIGEPKRVYRVEPLQAPVPTERPLRPRVPESSPRRAKTPPELQPAARR